MADAAAARREARRKRILENSHNRLQFISGKSSDECCRVSPSRSPIPEQNYELSATPESSSSSKSSLNNGILIAESETFDLLSPRHDIVAAGDGDVVNDLAAFGSSPLEPAQKVTIWDKLSTHKYDIVLLSLFIQFLYGFSFITLDSTYIFLPFAIYVVTKLIYFPAKNNSKFANMLLLLNGLSQQAEKLQKVLSITQLTGIVFQDMCIYLFTTICIQSLYISMKDSFVT
ncbi:uncharacterized protein ACR2FA_000108 [Aphomia sociella]